MSAEGEEMMVEPRGAEARLRVLNETLHHFSDPTLSLEALMNAVTRCTSVAFRDGCTLSLVTPDGEWLELTALHHPDPELAEDYRAMLSATRRRPSEGVSGRVIASGQPLLVPSIPFEQLLAMTDPRFHDFVRRHPIYSGAAAPLRADGETLGVLALLRFRADRPYEPDDLLLLQDLADRAAIAISHARLMAELRAARDRTEQIVAQRTDELRSALAEIGSRERFLESIVENIPNMIFVKDAHELRFVRFNRAGEELIGYRREELIGKNDYDLFPANEADFFTTSDRSVLASGDVLDIPEESIETKVHGTRLLHTRKIPVLDAEGHAEFLLGISEDITDRVRAQRELALRTAELARSNRDLEEFAYIASHDLQEPLRKIRAFGEMLADSLGDALSPEAAGFLSRMRASAGRMQTLISDLLAFSRVSTQTRVFAPVRLGSVAREVLDDLEVLVRDTGAQVVVAELPTIEADLFQMRQLFQNLLGNGLKFHREGVAPSMAIEAAIVGANCVLRFADNGIGFEPRYVDRIFKPFQRLHAAGTYEGTGIGLSICRKIVESHHGTLTAESQPGVGTTFVVTLPTKHREGTVPP